MTASAFANPWAGCFGGDAGGHAVQMSSSTPGDPPASPPRPASQIKPDAGHVREFAIVNQRGLHARASAKFVQTAERFDADIRVSRAGETVGGRSIMGLMMLAAARGTSIHVTASGPQAEAALDALQSLVASKFGEEA